MPLLTDHSRIDTSKARVYYSNGNVYQTPDDRVAYRMWLNAPKVVRAALRNAGDTTPVYSHDYVDTL